MQNYTKLLEHFKDRSIVVNIILDGYGIGKGDYTDGIAAAKTPFMDSLLAKYAHTKLATHGHYTGLPGKKDIGGSEVGHFTLGAGRIVPQGASLIDEQIKTGDLEKQPVLQELLTNAKNNKALHLLGLLSDGNVHSHVSHMIALIKIAAKQGVERCYIHALLDGRDVRIQSGDTYINQIEEAFAEVKKQYPSYEYAFASLGGREVITMDRDRNFAKIELAWKTHVQGATGNNFDSALAGLMHYRKENPDLVDQDCTPYNVVNQKGETIKIQDGDSVIFTNFRADRALEMTQAFVDPDFDGFAIQNKPKVLFASMMKYDADNDIPKNCLVETPHIEGSFGERLVTMKKKQFRLAETQKYAHVTFFYNGGYRAPLDSSLEDYILIPSDKINSFADAPKMKAAEIADKAVELIEAKEYEFGLINIANPDMVGHTGNFDAVITAIEATDQALAKICATIEKVGGVAVVSADHGNADEMIVVQKNGEKEISTKHSINLVPCVIFDTKYNKQYSLRNEIEGHHLGLSSIVATNYILMGQEPPSEFDAPVFDV